MVSLTIGTVISDLRAVTFGAGRQVFAFPHEPRLLLIYALVFAGSAALTAFALSALSRREQPADPATARSPKDWLVPGGRIVVPLSAVHRDVPGVCSG